MRRHLSAALVAASSLSLFAGGQVASAVDLSSGSSLPQFSSGGSDPSPAPALSDSFAVTEHGSFDEGWAMSFLPGTYFLMVTERAGAIKLYNTETDEVTDVSGVPEVYDVGKAGLFDIIPGPTFAEDGTVYLSWARPHPQGSQGVVATARLGTASASLSDVHVIWEQTPSTGDGHFSLRLLIQGEHLFVTSGERQKGAPAQSMDTNLGKILRLTLDGKPAEGNPWYDRGGAAAEFYSIGHRNILGIAEGPGGSIWASEMGPRGGDELNLIEPGENYGWPEASMGDNYDGSPIPDHAAGDGFLAPKTYWDPSISPANLVIYQGTLFPGWQGSALLGGLSGQTLVRVPIAGGDTGTPEAWDAGERVREVEVAPDGSIWILEDGAGGRLRELRPR